MRIQRERCRACIAAILFTANYYFTTPACAFNAIVIKKFSSYGSSFYNKKRPKIPLEQQKI